MFYMPKLANWNELTWEHAFRFPHITPPPKKKRKKREKEKSDLNV